jgi:hypothetical protein
MRSPILALVLAGVLQASLAWGAPALAPVAPPAAAKAGEWYVTELPALPPGTEEVELYLMPDDGSGRMLQLTPERDALEGPLRWRMPRTPATRARLVLRAGGPWGERESEPSAGFPVEREPRTDLSDVLRAREELAWQFGDDAGPSGSRLAPPGATALQPAAHRATLAAPTRGPGAEAPAPARVGDGPVALLHLRDPGQPDRGRRPAFVPLRN